MIKDVYNSLPRSKNRNSSIFVRVLIRPLSFVMTVPCLKMGLSPNGVSYISLIIAAGSIIALNYSFIAGSLLMILWLTMDCVDGNIARFKKIRTVYGDFVDSLSSFLIIFFLIGVMSINVSRDMPELQNTLIIWGVWVGSFMGFTRLVYQKYRVATLEGNIDNEVSASKVAMQKDVNKKSFMYIANRVEKNCGLSGFLLPALIIVDLLGVKYEFLLIYMVYSVITSGGTLALSLLKAHKNERER